jgi:hypothetical protein
VTAIRRKGGGPLTFISSPTRKIADRILSNRLLFEGGYVSDLLYDVLAVLS